MGRPCNADGHRTRHALLDAALQLFAQNGYHGTTLRDIAAAIGVRESAVYNYFPSKEALFEALIAGDEQSKVEFLSAAVADPLVDPRKALVSIAIFVLDHFSTPRQQQLFRILMSDGFRLAHEGRIDLMSKLSASRDRLGELMARLVRSGTLRAANSQFLAMEFMGSLLMWRHLDAVGSTIPAVRNRHAFAEHHVDQFLRGAMSRASDGMPRASVAERRRPRAPRPIERPNGGRAVKRPKRQHEGTDI